MPKISGRTFDQSSLAAALRRSSSSGSQFDPGRFGEQPAVEVIDPLKRSPAVFSRVFIASNSPPIRSRAVLLRFAVFQQPGDQVARQQADVFGEQGHQHLEDEPLGVGLVDRSTRPMLVHHLVEAIGQLVGGLPRDGHMVVAEDRLQGRREQERQRSPAGRQVRELDRSTGASIWVSKS